MAVVEDAVSRTDQPAAWACPVTRGENIRSSERKTISKVIVILIPEGTIGTERGEGERVTGELLGDGSGGGADPVGDLGDHLGEGGVAGHDEQQPES